jgi:hypothetical protein
MKPGYPEDQVAYEQLRMRGIPDEAVTFGWVVCNEEENLYYTETQRISAGFVCKDMGVTSEAYLARPFSIRMDAVQLAHLMPGYEVQIMIHVFMDTCAVIREEEIKNYKQLERIDRIG